MAIKTYFLYHDDGLAILYENKTTDLAITEELEFQMQNCQIDGIYGNYISVTVAPGRDRLIQLNRIKDDRDFEAKIVKLYYKITLGQ